MKASVVRPRGLGPAEPAGWRELQVARGSVDASVLGPSALARRTARVPRKYLRPWPANHPELEKAIAVRLSRRKMA